MNEPKRRGRPPKIRPPEPVAIPPVVQDVTLPRQDRIFICAENPILPSVLEKIRNAPADGIIVLSDKEFNAFRSSVVMI